MRHDFVAQRAETFDTWKEIRDMEGLPARAVVNFLFLADDLDAPFAECAKAFEENGFQTLIADDGETLEARIGPIDVNAASIWTKEKQATEIALPFGFEPDGWELVE